MSSNLHSVTLRYSAWFLYVITELSEESFVLLSMKFVVLTEW